MGDKTDLTIPDGYKQTDVGIIPEDWQVKRLGEIAEVASGGTPDRKNLTYWNGDIPWITTSQIDFNVITQAEQFITQIGLLNSAARKFSKGSLLMAMYGQGKTRGKIAILGFEATINQACAAIQINKNVFAGYVLHNLSNRYEEIRSLSNIGNQENLNGNIIKSIEIPLPPLPEQQAIAEVLSDVDALVTSLDRLIAKKRNLKQGAMQLLLTGKKRLAGFSGEWETKTFDELFEFLPTGSNSRSELSDYGDIKYIHYGDIHTKWRLFLDCKKEIIPFIRKEKVKNLPLLKDGDLILVDASEDYEGLGFCVELKNLDKEKVVAGLHTLLLRGNKTLVADGFKGYITSIKSVQNDLKRIATGISVFGISKNNLKSISVFLPSVEEQKAIAQILSDMDAEIEALEKRREKYKAVKQGMMQELLTGKTRLVKPGAQTAIEREITA